MPYLQNQFERNFMTTSVDYVFNWARKSAIWPLTFGLACCAIEMIASSTSRFDIARFGAEVFRRSVSPQPAPVGSDDRRRHGHAKDGAGPEAHLGSDARAEMVHLDGRLLVGWRTV